MMENKLLWLPLASFAESEQNLDRQETYRQEHDQSRG
jgi:hypothetical protein